MRKLIQGIADFRETKFADYKEVFAKLVLGQRPDALFIACSDSRVAANVFASTNPGDLFVVRNVGNCIPSCDQHGMSTGDESEAAAIEFSLSNLNVRDIIVCGHSDCGAIQSLINGREKIPFPNLKSWLRHIENALDMKNLFLIKNPPKEYHNLISQINVLLQVENLKTYPIVQERILNGTLKLHSWWFDLKTIGVHYYDESEQQFVLIDEKHARELLKELK
ncbi:MAG: carbonic anhydrase [Bdellovibrionales bacterium RIFOXYD12_FULL_39_22]|nr:MAG: carbonic anhydrase [Bdellovibrionales bacterium RIFOXYB1_FULL_39_21]OFZ48943.1 MAG: carbonic anhydrase [Bdellovibrionales bacterium RIFOXYC1_FULL_39_130]OFZ70955.1 MAG: carbonic anhydrase [Bdellovibrionales bacterium RIFOXYC2_FULL_39_8]OFZ77647.1 MAG: carbonic anhydrase [Bdellovibrionales bacterium RIFOXYD1_FULL_39_84]OFZ96101.1 MAG: carbonic anhydrase [Bdellovibrionales bacterium RIFOXYD12_FULL_39_22]HLE11639.1 carbonic anhydrase [Bacteriovoracaceae bacterium]